MTTLPQRTTVSSPKVLRIALWTAQIALALMFALAGGMKVLLPAAVLAEKMPDLAAVPLLARFIGVAELAGALGVVLPAATRIKPILTPLAAIGLLTVMVLATAFHVSRGELGAIPTTLVLGSLAAFVAWGRLRKAPIAARS